MAYQQPPRVFTLDSSDEFRKAECCTRTEILCAPAGSSPLHFHSLIYNDSFKELTTLHHYFSTFNAVTCPACVCQKTNDARSRRYRWVGSMETNWPGLRPASPEKAEGHHGWSLSNLFLGLGMYTYWVQTLCLGK